MEMKRIILSALLFLSFLGIRAQNKEEIKAIQSKTNVEALRRMSRHFELEEKANYAKALKYAKDKGWPIEDIADNGSTRFLKGITEDLKPIYSESLNLESGITTRTNSLYLNGGLGLNIHGENMTVGVWEIKAAITNHELFENRAIQIDGVLPIGHRDNYHATHVTGTLIGSDQFQTGRARGMAFKGNAHCYDWTLGHSELATAAGNGLLVSNFSLTATSGNSIYDHSCARFDTIQYFAPYHLVVFACGNSGLPFDRLYNATKNGLSVANVYKLPFYSGPVSVVSYDGTDTQNNGSSRGPSDDGRIKPDISAVGMNVFSSHGSTPTSYGFNSGTSMASPNVAGTLLLLQQYYTSLYPLNFMRSATLKGLVLHTADEAGSHPGPDITYGWGLLNARAAAETITEIGNGSIMEENNLANGATYSKTVVASSGPLIATICWTDSAGAPAGYDNNPLPRLVRDLDIRITSGGVTYYPWKLDSSNYSGPAIQGDNIRDNVEKIEISSPIQGQSYEITVTHKGSLPIQGQDYSLIVTGTGFPPICTPNDTIISPTVVLTDNNKQAVHNIVALNEVIAGSEAVYHAGDEIKMTDGFSAINGSTFRAYIEGCSFNYPARLAYNQRPVVTYSPEPESAELPFDESVVFPNPTDRAVTVSASVIKEGILTVKSITGEEVYRRAVKIEDQVTVDLGEVSSGVYILYFEGKDGSSFSKTVVKH